jgi:hypothetical protein
VHDVRTKLSDQPVQVSQRAYVPPGPGVPAKPRHGDETIRDLLGKVGAKIEHVAFLGIRSAGSETRFESIGVEAAL